MDIAGAGRKLGIFGDRLRSCLRDALGWGGARGKRCGLFGLAQEEEKVVDVVVWPMSASCLT